MTSAAVLIWFLWLAASPTAYFKYQRPVEVPQGSAQHYIVVDETLWTHARTDLGDLRLFSEQTEVPYSLVTERGNTQRDRTTVPVLQQSTVGAKTQFLIKMEGLAEYDHVELDLATKNFVAHARVEGGNSPQTKEWALLSDNILYDLSGESLGRNSMLRLPRSTYPYLRVTIDGPVKPKDIRGAASESTDEQPAHWLNLASTPAVIQKDKDTVVTFTVPVDVPVERVNVRVDAAQPNFWRAVEIQDANGAVLGTGEIKRVHLVRAGKKIDTENEAVNLAFDESPRNEKRALKVVIHNGDDQPLRIGMVQLQQLERRLYFETPAQGKVTLYYGDEKLNPPVYEYARLFQRDVAATQASLGSEAANASYSARPDDRPWSEQHPLILWSAIVAAVLLLGGMALRSMKRA